MCRPDARQIAPRIAKILAEEGIEVEANAVEELVHATHSDIRQILNTLSTYALTRRHLSFDDSKHLY